MLKFVWQEALGSRMPKISKLSQNPRFGEILRFVLVGGFVTVIGILNFAIFNLFLNYNLAYIFTCILGVSLQFILQNWIVFRIQAKASKAPIFAGVYILQFVIVWVVLFISVDFLSLKEITAYILANAIGVPITFALNRFVLTGNF